MSVKNVMIFLIVIYAVVLGILNQKSVNEEGSSEDGWRKVNHEQFDFSIEYPSSLSMILGNEKGYKGARHIRFSAYTESWQTPQNLSFTVETQPAETPALEDVVAWSDEDLDEIRTDPVRAINFGFEEISLLESQVGDLPVYRRRYAYRQSGLLFEEVYIARENDMVVITFRVEEEYFDEYLQVFNQMVDSFKPLR